MSGRIVDRVADEPAVVEFKLAPATIRRTDA